MLALRLSRDEDRFDRTHLTALELRVIGRKLEERLKSIQGESAGPETLIREYAAIDAARHRLHDGTYGQCARCGDPIDIARLLVDPAASRCARCESAALRR